MGESDLSGNCSIPIYNLNVTYPLVPDEITEFLKDKKAVLIVEEGMPNLIEEHIRAIAQRSKSETEIFGKDIITSDADFTPEKILSGVSDFILKFTESDTKSEFINEKVGRIIKNKEKAENYLQTFPITPPQRKLQCAPPPATQR